MGLFDSKSDCAICGNKIGLTGLTISNKQKVCSKCFKASGFSPGSLPKPMNQITIDDIKSGMERQEQNKVELESFVATKQIGGLVEFDDNQKKWLVLSGLFNKRNRAKVYNYSDIVSFELLEDGESVIKGGLGRALVGGALFGATGAIVGGVTGKRKSKEVCNSLQIKVTINDILNPTVYIKLIEAPTKKSSITYKVMYEQAQEILSTFQIICDSQ